jgi:hypothetical protein
VPLGSAGQLCHAGGGDWWVHPQVLAGGIETVQPDLKMLRTPQVVDDRTYQVLRIQRETENALQAMSYDLETGYLVYKGGMVKGAEATGFSIAVPKLPTPWLGPRHLGFASRHPT